MQCYSIFAIGVREPLHKFCVERVAGKIQKFIKEALNKSNPVIPGLLKAEPGIQAFQ